MTYEILQRRLMRFLWLFEALIIATCFSAGLNMALSKGGTFMAALPLLLIAAAETLRIPLASLSMRLSFTGRILSFVILAAIAVGSAEGLTLAFEQFVNNRVVTISRLQRSVAKAQAQVDAETAGAAEAAAALSGARADVDRLDTAIRDALTHAPVAPGFSGKTCTGRNGRTVTCDSDRTAQQTFATARKAHEAEVSTLRTERAKAQIRVEQLMSSKAVASGAADDLQERRSELAVEMSQSPMHRLAAAFYGVSVEDLTPGQFESVKKWGVIGLALAFATISMLVAMVAHAPEKAAGETKLSRALRAYLARRRKRVVAIRTVEVIKEVEVERIVEKRVDVPGPERVRIKYVPVPMSEPSKPAPGPMPADRELPEASPLNLKVFTGGSK